MRRPVSNFHAVWPSLFATAMGLMAFLPVLALYVKERFGIDDPQELAWWAGSIYGAAPLLAAIFGPLWGALGDRVGKKPMAIRANLAIAVATALMPLAGTPWLLLLMRGVQGAFAGYVAPAMALVSHDVPRERHGAVIGWLQVAMAMGSLIGPALGAEVAHWWGRAALFYVTSALAVVAALQLHVFAHEERSPPAADAPSFGREFARSFAAICRNRVFVGVLALVFVFRIGQNMLEPFIVLLVRELGPVAWLAPVEASRELQLDRTTALAFAVLALMQLLCTPLWGRQADRFGPLRCFAVLALLLAAVLAAIGWVASIDQFLVLRTAAASLMAGSMTLAYAAISKRVAAARRTLAFAMLQSCIQFGLAAGPMLGALVADDGRGGTDFRRVPLAAAGLCAVAGFGMLWLRRLPTTVET